MWNQPRKYSKPEPRIPYYETSYGRFPRPPLIDPNPPRRWPWWLAGLVFSLLVWGGIGYGVSYVQQWITTAVPVPTDSFADLQRQQLDQIRQLQQALNLAQHQNADLKVYNDELKKMLKAKNRATIP